MTLNKFQNIPRIIVGLILIFGGSLRKYPSWTGKPDEPEARPPVRPLENVHASPGLDPGKKISREKSPLSTESHLAFRSMARLSNFRSKKEQDVTKGDLLAQDRPQGFPKISWILPKPNWNKPQPQLQRITKAAQSGQSSKTDLTNAQAAL